MEDREIKRMEQDLRNLFIEAIKNTDYREVHERTEHETSGSFLRIHGASLGSIFIALSTERQEQIQREQAISSKVFANWSIALIITSIVISVVTSTVVICSSNSWQAEQTPLLNKIANNTKPAEPAKYPAEHTALLTTIADNTKQLQILMEQIRKDEQPTATDPAPMVDIGTGEQPAATEPEPQVDN